MRLKIIQNIHHIFSPNTLLNKIPKRKRHEGINFSTFLKLVYLNQKEQVNNQTIDVENLCCLVQQQMRQNVKSYDIDSYWM